MLIQARALRTPVRALIAVAVTLVWLGGGAGAAWATGIDMQMTTKVQTPPDPVPVGTLMTIQLNAENSGTLTASNPKMEITLPAAVDATFVSASSPNGTCDAAPDSNRKITCLFGATLKGTQGGGGAPVSVTVMLTPIVPNPPGVITTTATVSSDLPVDSNPGNETLDIQTTVIASADLTIANVVSGTQRLSASSPVIAGGRITYSTVVHNNSLSSAADAKVTFTVPTGLDYDASSVAGADWSCAPLALPNLICTHAHTIAGGADATTLTWSGKITTTSGNLVLGASVASKTPDSVGSNNIETITSLVTNGADLTVAKTIGAKPAIGGQASVFTLTVNNAGPFAAADATVTDLINPMFDVASATGAPWVCSIGAKVTSGTPISCTRGSTAVGAAGTIVITATPDNTIIPAGNNALTNAAHAGSAATLDGDLSNNDAHVDFDLLRDGVDLQIGITRDPHPFAINTPVITTITVHNNGPRKATPALPIEVIYTLATGEVYDNADSSDPGWACAPSTGIVTCTYSKDILYTQSALPLLVTTHATAGGAATPLSTNPTVCTGQHAGFAADTNPDNDCLAMHFEYFVSTASADLEVTKTLDTTSPLPFNSDTITYTLKVKNLGPDAATNVDLTDTIPMYVDALYGRPATTVTATSDVTCTGSHTVACTWASIAKDEVKTVSITVKRPIGNSQAWVNSATAYSRDVGDPHHNNNTADAPSVSVDSVAEIELVSKNITPASVKEGVDAVYTLTARNNGPSLATNVRIDDTFNVTAGAAGSGTFTFLEVTGTAHTGAATCTFDQGTYKAHCDIGDLASGEQQVMTVRIRPNFLPGFRVSGSEHRDLTNTAVVATDTPESDGAPLTAVADANNTKSATLQIIPGDVDLVIHKGDLGDPVAYDVTAGKDSLIVYKIEVTNGGPSFATGVHFVDTYPASASPSTPGVHSLQFMCDLASAAVDSTCPVTPANICTGGAGSVSCAAGSGGDLAAGDSFTRYLVFKVEQAPLPTGTTFLNTVDLLSNEHETLQANNHANENTTVRILADMELTSKTASLASVRLNENFTWAIAIKNKGPGLATAVKVTDSLPAGMVLTGAPSFTSGGPGTCDGAAGDTSLTCYVTNDMANGDTATITVPVKITSHTVTEDLTNTATVSTKSIDLVSSNDSADGKVTVLVSSVSGHVYHDKTNSGSFVSGNGIPGVKVTLTGTDDLNNVITPITQDTTGTDGTYSFTSLRPGTYIVTEDQADTDLAPYLDGKDTLGTVNAITAGANAIKNQFTGIVLGSDVPVGTGRGVSYDFGEVKPVSIAGVVWHDQNNDGAIGGTEPDRIGGVDVTLSGSEIDATGASVAITPVTVQTAVNGTYSITKRSDGSLLRPGTYTVTETQPVKATTGYIPGLAAKGKIGSAAGNGTPHNTLANADFGNVIDTITLASGDAATEYDFGELKPATVAGKVYYDADRSGGPNGSETGLGKKFTITLSGTDYLGKPVSKTADTDPTTGAFSFTDLAPADSTGYTVTETTTPTDYFPGAISAGTGPVGTPSTTVRAIAGIKLMSGNDGTAYDFGHTRASIGGYAYHDQNNDGLRAGDAGIDAVTITLHCQAPFADVTAVTLTDVSGAGHYQFNDVPPCTDSAGYKLIETQPTAYSLEGMATVGTGPSVSAGTARNTLPVAPINLYGNSISGIKFGGGEVATEYNFGDMKSASLSGIVYYDKNRDGTLNTTPAAEAGIDGVTIKLTGKDYLGNPVSALPQTTAGGAFSFPNLKPSDATGYTLTETQPSDYFDGTVNPGTEGGTGTVANIISAIKLASGKDSTANNFGETRASLSGVIYHDKNYDGLHAGDPGIAATSVVTLSSTCSPTIPDRPADSDTSGVYTFDDILPCAGGYTLTETTPTGYLPGKATTGVIETVATGTDSNGASDATFGNVISVIKFTKGVPGTEYNFGEVKESSLAGNVYLDKNHSDKFETGNPGIQGVIVTLSGKDYRGRDVTASNLAPQTDIDGHYAFTHLPPASAAGYSVTETPPTGYFDGAITAGIPPLGTTDVHAVTTIKLLSDTAAVNYDFGHKVAGLNGYVYYDKNNDGIRSGAAEVGIGGVKVTLSGASCGSPSASLTTSLDATTANGTGSYGFDNLPPCANGWTLTETAPATGGYLPGLATVGAGGTAHADGTEDNTFANATFGNVISGITLNATDLAQNYNFGELKLGSIAGNVYYDIDQLKTRNGTEPGIGGVTLTLTGTDYRGRPIAAVVKTTDDTTDATRGNYLFDTVPPGSYIVAETQPGLYADGSVQRGSLGGTEGTNSLSVIPVTPEDAGTAYNFGEIAGGLSGTVFDDPDNNGDVTSGDHGIKDVTVTVTGCGLAAPIVVKTDADGHYFAGPLATCSTGYTITETQPADYSDGITKKGSFGGTDTTPNVISSIPVNSATNGITYNFGEHAKISTDIACALTAPVAHNMQQPFNLAFTIANGSAGAAPAGKFTQTLPAGFVLTAVPTSAQGTCTGTVGGTSVSCDLGFVTIGASFAITVPVKAISYPAGGTIETTGMVTTDGADTGAPNNSCKASLPTVQSTLAGLVFRDDNNNGTQQTGEEGIVSTTIKLTGKDLYGNAVALSVPSNADGTYSFAGLAPADEAGYTVTETQPAGYVDGIDTLGDKGGTLGNDVVSAILLAAGVDAKGYNFAEIGKGLSGKVYVDSNNNGVPDATEAGIGGVIITITGTSADGHPVNLTATTAADGTWIVGGLPPTNAGGYTVTESQPSLWADGKDAAGSAGGTVANDKITAVILTGSGVSTGYNFGERGGMLCGFVYNDGNDNGLKDANEAGIAAVMLTLTGNDANGQPITRTTKSNLLTALATQPGRYCLNDLPVSDGAGFTITETQPPNTDDGKVTPGSLGGTAGTNVITGIAITTAGAKGDNNNFGEIDHNAATLSGFVFLDNHHDGIHRPGDGRGGWIVELVRGPLGNAGKVIATTTSNPDGSYDFSGLPPGGGYTVIFRNPENHAVYGYLSNLTLLSATVLAEQNQPLDPSGVIFNSVTGKPLPGSIVTIHGPPGFNPATDLVGGQPNVNQTTGTTGEYKYLLWPTAPAGVYTITVTPPPGYLPIGTGTNQPCVATLHVGAAAPGYTYAYVNVSNTPVALGAKPANPNTCPADSTQLPAAPGQYYAHFYLDGTSVDVLNNHISLDPIPLANALIVAKSTPKTDVIIGELVPYTITVKNAKTYAQSNAAIVDQLPPGFKYRTGSAKIDGVAVEPVASGRDLTWPAMPVAAGQTITLKLLMTVGSGVGEAEFVNQAWTVNTVAHVVSSNVATATVRVTPDPTFDCTDVIGKVYEDRNRNGYPDAGEKGIGGVRLVSVNGLLITTDADGRYHIACADIPDADRGSNFILKVDTHTLPTGYRLTTENPGLVRITRGKLAKLNFGASIAKVVRVDMLDQAFVAGSLDLSPQWAAGLGQVLTTLTDPNAVLRVAYGVSTNEDPGLAEQRLRTIADRMRSLWREQGGPGDLTVETELYHVAGLK